MAKLDSRNDSFISLLLNVSGKARPEDMSGMSLEDAAALLQAFAGAHPEMSLSFDGKVLAPSMVATPPAAAPPSEPVASVQEPTAVEEVLVVPAVETAAPAETPLYVPAVEIPEVELPAVEPAFSIPEVEIVPAEPTFAIPEVEIVPAEPTFAIPEVEIPAIEPALSIPALEMPEATSELPAWVFEGSAPGERVAESAPVSLADIGSVDLGATQAPPAHESVFGPAPQGDSLTGVVQAPAADYGVPAEPELGGYYGVADAAPPEYATSEGAAFAPAGDNVPENGFRSSSDALDS